MSLFAKKSVAEAVVLEDEGSGKMMETDSHGVDWEWHKFILEVHPDGEAPFRTETKAKVPIFHCPQKGDRVKVEYEPKSHNADIQIEGDARYDPKLRRQMAKNDKQAEKQRVKDLLDGKDPAPAPTYHDPEIDELEELERLEALSGGATTQLGPKIPAQCPECGARLDQNALASMDSPTCPFCHKPIPIY